MGYTQLVKDWIDKHCVGEPQARYKFKTMYENFQKGLLRRLGSRSGGVWDRPKGVFRRSCATILDTKCATLADTSGLSVCAKPLDNARRAQAKCGEQKQERSQRVRSRASRANHKQAIRWRTDGADLPNAQHAMRDNRLELDAGKPYLR